MAVKSSELRIGNWFLSAHGNLPFQWMASDFENIDTTQAKPIPLTNSILKKTNMVHSFPYGGNNGYYELNGFYLHYDMEEENYFFIMYERKLIKINSFHQLQNLYFALTNTELNIQL